MNVEGFVTEGHATLVIDLTKSLDEIWRDMDKSSCRYAINRAIREGLKFIEIRISRSSSKFTTLSGRERVIEFCF